MNKKRPNIVFVLTDQWRAQAFGYSGDPNVKTPNIDRLAEKSLNFENAVSVCPVCTPQRAALLTGRLPTTTGMFLNDLYLPAEEVSMADILKAEGYDTGYIGKWHLDGHGRDAYIPPERRQGFDYWKVLECTHDYNNSKYYAGDDPTMLQWEGYDAYAQTKDAEAYIRDHAEGENPFLLFVGYGGPHFPHHNAPEELMAMYPSDELILRPNVSKDQEELTRQELPGYYGHCTAIDRCIGDLVQTIEKSGIAEETIFIFTSDHGDMHGSHGKRSRRKQLPWDESICVPFLCYSPSIHEEGRRVTTPLSTQDILPTLLSLAGVPSPENLDGDDLSDVFRGEKEDDARGALFMSVAPFAGTDYRAYRGIRTSKYSYVRDSEGPWLLYDNEQDPYQMNNLVDDPKNEDLQAQLENQLQGMLEKNGDVILSGAEAKAKWKYKTDKEGGGFDCSSKGTIQSPGPKHGLPRV